MTNDTTPATDDVIAWVKRELDVCNNKELVGVSHGMVASLIARIEALQSEITALKTAPRELVDSIKYELVMLEGAERDGDWNRVHNSLARFRSALSAQEPKVCEWTPEANQARCFRAGCEWGQLYHHSGMRGFKFCPYCGGVIKVKE